MMLMGPWLVLVVAVIAAVVWASRSGATTQVVEGAPQVDVDAGELWFDPTTVELTVGEPVTFG